MYLRAVSSLSHGEGERWAEICAQAARERWMLSVAEGSRKPGARPGHISPQQGQLARTHTGRGDPKRAQAAQGRDSAAGS